jgi:arylsulfatase A-like enzyme
MNWKSFVYLTLLAAIGCDPSASNVPKPNILLIVVDDLGYADLGCYGGDIETPNLDALASTGIRFSRFHTAPFCAVTRAMLLSGNNNHIAGMGSQDLRTGITGYEGQLTNRIIPLPQLLKDAGYHTSMAGKWHLGRTPEANPHNKGFEHSFVLLEGAGNHYNDVGFSPHAPVSPYTEDGEAVSWPEGAYSTELYTDKIISYLDRYKDDSRPFFAYVAYTSPHWPLQVDPVYWKKYAGRYDEGYEVLKERRLVSLKKAGMIPEDALLPPNHPRVQPWSSLSDEEKKIESRKMELYAGMVDNLDANIGRLLNYLKETGEYDNTLIVFISDNGAAGEDFYHHEYFGPFIQEHYANHYDSMGKANSFVSYGPPWAEAGSSPFRYYKGFTTEGGVTAPMIISGPGLAKSGETTHAFTTLMDLAPTFYDVAEIEYPTQYQGKAVFPLLGRSLVPLLTGKTKQVHAEDYVFGLEHRGYVMIRKGDWKLVNTVLPLDTANFELFDLRRDLAEQQNLKSAASAKYQEMMNEWKTFAQAVGVKIPTPKQGEGLTE